MDYADAGTATAEATRNAAVSHAMLVASKAKPLELTGYCRNPRCGDNCEKVFCGAGCRDEWEALNKARRIRGN